jgi:hypothetical protein
VVSVAPASAATRVTTKTVRYRSYALRVPTSWPVFRLASDPSACVRFNRHAVYLGHPSSQQRCPAHAVGRTEAILVAPAAGAKAPMLTEARSAQARGPVGQLTMAGRGVVITATWGRDPGAIERAFGVRTIPQAANATRAAAAATPATVHATRAATTTAVHTDAVNIGGLGFDTCAAPSATAMSAWLTSSPFRAAAIYIGGANSACAQPNLTAAYVSAESVAGWQFIPVYVGLQAPTSSCGCQTIAPAQAAAQGTAAAIDAVAQAQALGIGAGNPIYLDMESYSRTTTSTTAVLGFIFSWTTELHAYGYVSGVYGSGLSGIADLVAAGGTTVGTSPFVEPDDLWIADWNNQATASDPSVPTADWSNNQRLHQYRGGHVDTYGGVSLDIDSDYLDGATATAGVGSAVPPTLPDGTFVTYSGKTYRLAGAAPLLVHSWSAFGAQQPTVALSGAQWQALKPVPTDGTFIRATGTGKVYEIAGGSPVYVHSWSDLGGAQPAVVIDRWNILNVGNPASHMTAAPANGTIVKGMPSGQYWLFSTGWRAQTAPSTTAVTVSDAGLSPFLDSPTVTRDTLSGVAKRSPALRIVLTAGANAPALKRFVLALPAGLSFSGSAASLTKGVVMWWTANGKPLTSSASVSGGKLRINLASPARKVLITVSSPALSATRALVAQIRTGAASALAVTVYAVDAKHNVAALTLNPRTS